MPPSRAMWAVLAVCALCLPNAEARADDDEGIVVQLWTTEPGASFAGSWGHTFLRIKTFDPPTDQTFDFGRYVVTSTFLLDLVRGELPYHLESNGAKHTFEWMKQRDRTLISRTITLPEETATALAKRLTALDTPEHRQFRYDPATANCATRVRDLLDEIVFEGRWSQAAQTIPSISFHDANEELMAGRPGYRWLVAGAFGPGFHQPRTAWEMTVLPHRLGEALDSLADGQGPIPLPEGVSISAPKAFHTSTRPPEPPSHVLWSPPGLTWLLLTLAMTPVLAQPQRRWAAIAFRASAGVWSVLGGLVGIGTVLMIVHPSARYGVTLVIMGFHPLLFLLPWLQRSATQSAAAQPWAQRMLWVYAVLPTIGLAVMVPYGQPIWSHLLPPALTQWLIAAGCYRIRQAHAPR